MLALLGVPRAAAMVVRRADSTLVVFLIALDLVSRLVFLTSADDTWTSGCGYDSRLKMAS